MAGAVSVIDFYESRMVRNSQIHVQTQSQTLTQTLSPQQVLEAKVLELSTLEIEERVRAETNEIRHLKRMTHLILILTDTETIRLMIQVTNMLRN